MTLFDLYMKLYANELVVIDLDDDFNEHAYAVRLSDLKTCRVTACRSGLALSEPLYDYQVEEVFINRRFLEPSFAIHDFDDPKDALYVTVHHIEH